MRLPALGDIILDVDGARLKGNKATKVMRFMSQEEYVLTVARQTGGGNRLPYGEHEGWVHMVHALNGEALVLERPKKACSSSSSRSSSSRSSRSNRGSRSGE